VSIVERNIETIGLRPQGSSEHEIVAFPDGVVRLRRKSRRSLKRAGSNESAHLASVAFQGEVKKALVEMAPLSWDASREQIRLAKKPTVTLSFARPDPNEVVGTDGRLSLWKGKRNARGVAVVARLATKAPGFYGVSYEEVFGALYRRREVRASRLRLSRLGEAVAYHLEPASSRFAPGSTLYFVSAGSDANPYGKEAVFELEYPVAGGAMMQVEDATPSGASTSWYLRRDEHEENRIYLAGGLETREHHRSIFKVNLHNRTDVAHMVALRRITGVAADQQSSTSFNSC